MKMCPKCGNEFPDDWTFCGQCATALVPKGAGVAPPQAKAPPPGNSTAPQAPQGPTLGSLGARVVAHLIDLVFLALAFWMTGTAYGAWFGGLTESGFNLNGLPALVIISLTLVFFLIYLIVFEGLVGATPGKLILGLRVKTVGGQACSMAQAVVRNLLRIADGMIFYLVGLITALVTKKRQRVGDLAASTVVARESCGTVARAGAAIFLLACVVGVIFASMYLRRHPRVPIATFAITNVRFADSETGPARTSPRYKPEEEVALYYEVVGYARDPDGQIAVVTQNQLLAPDGKPFFENKTIETRQKVAADAGPVKMHFTIGLPPWAPPGQFTINVQAEDQVAHKTQSASPAFSVDAPPIEASATFVVKDIELAASRDGAALSPPVFTAGQSVWLRFRILGMKADDKGRVVVTEDWGVTGPDGKSAFQKTDDSMIDDQFIYPPPFVPYREYVTLPSSVDPGEYRFHVTLHDKNGGADFTIDQPFTINKP